MFSVEHEQQLPLARASSFIREHSSNRTVRQFSAVLCLLIAATLPLVAQTSRSSGYDDSTAPVLQEEPSLSADRIVRIFREHPELMAMARSEVEVRDPSQAANLNETTVTQKLRSDPQLRARVTRFLIERGYVDEDDPELLRNTALANSSQPADDMILSTDAPRSGSGSAPQNQRLGSDSPDDYTDGPNTTIGSNGRYSDSEGTDRAQLRPGTKRRSTSTSRNVSSKPDETQTSKVRRSTPPYEGIPALRDLYSQTVEDRTKLKRFGMQIFDDGQFLTTTTDVPAGTDYVLGAGDGLRIELWGSISRRYSVVVDREGRIAVPDVGTVMVAGKTLGAARELIDRSLSREYRNINSDVSLARIRSVRVYVVGDVNRPGAYEISALSTALNALYVAGGPTANGSLREVKHLRGDKVIAEVDTYDLLLRGLRGDAARIEPGDTILVPPVHRQVAVAGAVSRPAIYELRNETTLEQVLQLAGGLLVSASYRDVRVERVQSHQQRVLLPVQLPASADPAAINSAMTAFSVEDGDRITIGSIATFSNASVYLVGHVSHPGKYSYHSGMRLTDLVPNYQDLMPEPADHAEIVRLEKPDWKPRVIDFNLRTVLDPKSSIELQPFDTVRIYSRYAFDPPKVSINGEVLRPGQYPMSDGMLASDLLRMAGGFKRSAFTQTADLTSYSINDGKRVELDTREVSIGQAIKGVEDTDVRLKPGDVLTIRQMPGWGDIGASITISGEVQYPGTYGIAQGERLSSVLKRAGGFRDASYPRGAVLKREQVREIDAQARDTLMHRIQSANPNIKGGNPEAASLSNAFMQQQQQILKRLREQPLPGRQVIHISSNISEWENTAADVEVRAGDELIIPKRPTFVAVEGQVNSPSAITYVPGKKAEWYLKRAGGMTEFANSKSAFIVRTDGSVVGNNGGFWGGGVTDTVLQPGDSLVVPEKIVTDSSTWRSLMSSAQVMSSIAAAAMLATRL